MKAYESLGVSAEDYLEAIFVLERQMGAVRSIDVARWLEHALSAESFEKLKQMAR